MGKLTETQKKHLLNEIENVEYGSVTIELNELKNNVEITTVRKKRFKKEAEKPRAGMPVRRNG